MYKAFKPDNFSVVFALNLSSSMSDMIIASMMSDQPCNYQVARLVGKYEGVEEISYQVDKRAINWNLLLPILSTTKQDMVLHIDQKGDVRVGVPDNCYGIDNFSPVAGQFVEVSEQEATQSRDYTYCYLSDKYYVIK